MSKVVREFRHKGVSREAVTAAVEAAEALAVIELGGPVVSTSRFINTGDDVEYTWTLAA